jgi:hypothetical protein
MCSQRETRQGGVALIVLGTDIGILTAVSLEHMADGEFLGMRCRNIQRSAVRGVKLKICWWDYWHQRGVCSCDMDSLLENMMQEIRADTLPKLSQPDSGAHTFSRSLRHVVFDWPDSGRQFSAVCIDMVWTYQ